MPQMATVSVFNSNTSHPEFKINSIKTKHVKADIHVAIWSHII